LKSTKKEKKSELKMRVEVQSAADFVMNLLRVKHGKGLTDIQLEKFKGSLSDLMLVRYKSHWYPDLPTKGSGYRCIRINGKMDPMIEQAGVAVGLQPRQLRKMLPQELTMWIDPDEVAYRIGENGSICVLLDAIQSRSSPSSDLDSTGSEELLMERVDRLDISDISMIDYLVDATNSKTSSNSSTPPPLSPPFSNYNNHHNNRHYNQRNHYNYNQYHYHNNHHQSNNNHNNNNHHNNQQSQHHQNHLDNSMYHWDSGFNNFNNYNNKVRTQC
jgi:protein Tob/BTG